jgi:hypothetical protein
VIAPKAATEAIIIAIIRIGDGSTVTFAGKKSVMGITAKIENSSRAAFLCVISPIILGLFEG